MTLTFGCVRLYPLISKETFTFGKRGRGGAQNSRLIVFVEGKCNITSVRLKLHKTTVLDRKGKTYPISGADRIVIYMENGLIKSSRGHKIYWLQLISVENAKNRQIPLYQQGGCFTFHRKSCHLVSEGHLYKMVIL